MNPLDEIPILEPARFELDPSRWPKISAYAGWILARPSSIAVLDRLA